MQQETIETDVLCVGGGIAGSMAAIRASELGASVVIAEKGNILHSGCGRGGNDHFTCYIPEIHGHDIEKALKGRQNFRGVFWDTNTVRTRLEKSFEIVKLWDSWGIPMKHQGEYEFAGHGYPGSMILSLKYSGHRQKPILTEQALKRGVKILNRVMVFDLLYDEEGIIGAVGVATREDKIVVIGAKSVVLGTGIANRLYPSAISGRIFNTYIPPTLTGDGRAMAYRAGAELAGLETTYKHCGPKYFGSSGQATWTGVIRDAEGRPIGPFITRPDKRYGDAVLERYPALFEEYARSGRGPVYMDCTGISEEDYEHMMYFMKHEGIAAVQNHLQDEGIDLRKNPVEFMRYEMQLTGGIYYNEKAETTLRGLYAAGDERFGGICNAAVFGWIAGENAAGYAREANAPGLDNTRLEIEEKKRLLNEIKSRKTGASWEEINFALQQTMRDYAGDVRSQTLLDAGLSHLRRLKRKAQTTMAAKNQWELTRCLEVLNLLDLGELIFIAAGERKETRGRHIRPDYPVTNPQLDKAVLFIKKMDGKAVAEFRDIQD